MSDKTQKHEINRIVLVKYRSKIMCQITFQKPDPEKNEKIEYNKQNSIQTDPQIRHVANQIL